MPIYEYRCDQGHSFEVMQRMTDEPVQTCATCEAPVQRVFHPVAVHFKGSGFYNTDYGKQRRGRSGEDGDGGSDSGGDAKATPSKGSDDGKSSSGESKDKSSGESTKSGGDSSSKAASGAGSSTS
jgi:putative FmdB family regulatory protein